MRGQFSGAIHAATVHTYKDQRISPRQHRVEAAPEECTPWQAEWNVLLGRRSATTGRTTRRRAALSNLAALMGRAAVHSGKIVTWEEAMASNFQFCPDIASLDGRQPAAGPCRRRGPLPGAGPRGVVGDLRPIRLSHFLICISDFPHCSFGPAIRSPRCSRTWSAGSNVP